MTSPLKILGLPLLLLSCAAFAQSYQYVTTPFAKLRGMASFEARVDSVIYWDQKEVKLAETPELWVYVTQTNRTRLILVWHDATTQHLAFARSLQVSNSYRFPDVWDQFDVADTNWIYIATTNILGGATDGRIGKLLLDGWQVHSYRDEPAWGGGANRPARQVIYFRKRPR